MSNIRIQDCQLWLPDRGDTLNIGVIQDTNCSADDSVLHGQNQKGK